MWSRNNGLVNDCEKHRERSRALASVVSVAGNKYETMTQNSKATTQYESRKQGVQI